MGGGLFAALAGRESNGSGGTWTGSDEEGLGLLKQQLSAVQRIRVEHERKESVIAGLRLEVRRGRCGEGCVCVVCVFTPSLAVFERRMPCFPLLGGFR